MGDNDVRLAVQKPAGPMKRASLPRMNDKINLELETKMANRKKKGKNASANSTNSPPSTPPPQSTPIKSLNSSLASREGKSRQRAGTPVSGIYPNLSNVSNESLDISLTSTPGSSSFNSKSSSQTDSSYSSSYKYTKISTSTSFSHSKSSKIETEGGDFIPKENNAPKRILKNKNQSLLGGYNGIGIILVVAIAVVPYFFGYFGTFGKTQETFNQTEFKSKIANLRGLFPSQDMHIWNHFGSGIADVRNGNHTPAIFLLVADHEETTNCLAKRVAELARSTLNGTGDVVLTPDKLENDIGKVIDFMENRMNQTKAVVITDVLSIQPEAMKAFHDVCDEYTKLVNEAVYLFTMSSGLKTNSQNLREFAEKQLTEKFSNSIIEDTLKALIVRITSGSVLAIKKEQLIPCSN